MDEFDETVLAERGLFMAAVAAGAEAKATEFDAGFAQRDLIHSGPRRRRGCCRK